MSDAPVPGAWNHAWRDTPTELTEDLAELLPGWADVYPPGVDVEELRWRYFSRPHGGRVYVIRDEGVSVSQMALARRDLTLDGERVPAWHSFDSLTLHSHRRRGYLRTLCNKQIEDTRALGHATSGYPNHNSARGFVDTGWKNLGFEPTWEGPLGEDTSPEGFVTIGAEDGGFLERLWLAQDRVGVYRDAAWMKWRLSRPRTSYRTYTTATREALLVLKVYGEGEARILNVCELLTDPARPELAEAALQLASAVAREVGAKKRTAWIGQGTRAKPAFEAAGFTQVPSDRVVLMEHPPGLEALADESRWHQSQLDSDVY